MPDPRSQRQTSRRLLLRWHPISSKKGFQKRKDRSSAIRKEMLSENIGCKQLQLFRPGRRIFFSAKRITPTCLFIFFCRMAASSLGQRVLETLFVGLANTCSRQLFYCWGGLHQHSLWCDQMWSLHPVVVGGFSLTAVSLFCIYLSISEVSQGCFFFRFETFSFSLMPSLGVAVLFA